MGTWRRLTTRLHGHPSELGAPVPSPNLRGSLALQQLVPVLAEAHHPAVLDLGCVWQATVAFFTGMGCKVYTEDFFSPLSRAVEETSAEAPPLSQRFLPGLLHYPDQHFRSVLAWDLFDYLPDELVEPLAARLYALLQPGGTLLVLFHQRREDGPFLRYRVLDGHTLELLPGSLPLRLRRTYAHRALLNLFAAFRSSRTFVGRDNLRELFLLK